MNSYRAVISNGDIAMKVLAVCSGKGGVGKTFSALSLAVEFSIRGVKRILVIDADPSRNASTRLLKIEPDDAKSTLADVFRDKDAKIEHAIYETTDEFPGIDVVVGSGDLDRVDQITAGRKGVERILRKALAGVAQSYDLVVIDSPPSRGTVVVNCVAAADAFVTPFALDDGSIDGVFAIEALVKDLIDEEVIEKAPLNLGAFVTQYDKPKAHGTKAVMEAAVEYIGDSLLQIKVPASAHVREAIASRTTLQFQKKHPVARAYQELADHIDKRLGITSERKREEARHGTIRKQESGTRRARPAAGSKRPRNADV